MGIFNHPTWSQFLSFKFIHLFTIFIIYFVRITPFYYKHSSNLINAMSNDKTKKRDKNRNTFSTVNWPHSQVFMVTPTDTKLTESNHENLYDDINDSKGSIDVIKLAKAITDYSDANDVEDTLHISAPHNILAFYDHGSPTATFDSTMMSTNNYDNNRLTVPPVYITPVQSPLVSPNSMKIENIHSMNTTGITFETYHDWRNRISIDCVIRCIVMIFTTFASYCSVSIYYMTQNYDFLDKDFDSDQFIISTYYFIISIVVELMLYGILYISMKYLPSNGAFNIFQPFACLYAKSTHPYHYAILFVVCSWWIY